MIVYNPYLNQHLEYPINFDARELDYYIQHETPFTDRHSEWAVSILENGDMIYVPYGNNRCQYIYIVTKLYIDHIIDLPYGIYTISINHCMD